MLYYFVAALISGSSNVSTANFSPRNNKANVHYWIPKELPGTVNWKKKTDLLTWLTGTFIQQKCLHQGAVVSILWVFSPSFSVLICPTWIIIHSLMAAVTLSKMTDVESSVPDLCLFFSVSVSHKHTLLVLISVLSYGHVISCVGCIWIKRW